MGCNLCFLIFVGFVFGFFVTCGRAMPFNGEIEDDVNPGRVIELTEKIPEGCAPGDNSVRCLTRAEMKAQTEDLVNPRHIPDIFCDTRERPPIEDCQCVNGLWQCAAVDNSGNSLGTGSRLRRETPLTTELKNTPCAPNDYFQIDCNTCYCKIDRTGYLCTENISCEEFRESSTTRHIPMPDGATLVISDRGAHLINDTNNNNDNNISTIPQSVTETYRTSPILAGNDLVGTNVETSTTPASATTSN